MKLRVHCITHGRYYKAGEDVPDAPPSFAKYAVSEDGDAADLERKGPMLTRCTWPEAMGRM